MKLPSSCKPIACLLAGQALALAVSYGQDATILGRVVDDNVGLALGGALVQVVGTNAQAYTDSQGNYSLSNAPAGNQTLRISYIGYQPVLVTLEVPTDGTTRANAAFATEAAYELDPVRVEGSLVGAARALNLQRAAASLSNIVASDEIGRFPDQNAAESLSRLPGVSVYRDQGEGRFVNVRGINYTLGNVTLDGSGLASPESGQRAIALDVVPSDSLGALEVSKVPTPDKTHEGLGGNVNLRSKSPFDRDGLAAKFSTQYIYSALNGGDGYKINGEYSNVSDDRKIGFLVGFSQQEREFGSYNVETDRWTREDPPEGDTSSPFFSPIELQFRDYLVERERTGVNAAVEFRPSESTSFWLRGNYNEFRDTEDRQNFFVPVSDDNVNAPVAKQDNTTGVVSEARRFSRRARDREKLQDLVAFTAGGETRIGNLTLDAQAAYSRGKEDKSETQVRFRRSTRDTSFRYEIDGYDVRLDQLNSPPAGAFEDPAAYNQFQRFDVESDQGRETETNLMVNARYDLDNEHRTYLKFGAGIRNKEKTRDEEVFEYANNGSGLAFADYTDTVGKYRFGPRIPRIDTPRIVSFFENNPNLFELDESDGLGNDYVVDEDVLFAYGMTGMNFGRINLIVGLRLERTKFSTTGNILDEDSQLIGQGSAKNSYTDVLPGLHIRYDTANDTVLRGSISQSIVRPAFGEAAFGRAIDSEDFEIKERNPDLEALNATNLDISLERYLPSLGLFSAAAYYKDVKDFTFVTNVGTRVIDGDTYDVFRDENGNDGYIYGLELAHQQQLAFLPGNLGNLSIQSNLTLSRSKADYGDLGTFDFVGQSEVMGNMSLTYEDKRFLARLAVNYRGERLREDEDISPGSTLIYIDDSLQLDLTLSYELDDKWEVFAEIVNLTNEPFRVFTKGGPENQPKLFQQIEEYDYSIYSGIRWKF